MKTISLWQPWASLVAIGAKRYETRSWQTPYHNGPLLIHAAKKETRELNDLCRREPFKSALFGSGYPYPEVLPRGSIIAVAHLAGCLFTGANLLPESISEQERAFGDFGPDRWMWLLEDVVRLPTPVPCVGRQGLFVPSGDVMEAVAEQLRAVPHPEHAPDA